MESGQLEVSPQALSRIGGWLYLVVIALGLFGEAFVRDRIFVPGDATATAANIRSQPDRRSPIRSLVVPPAINL